VEGLLAVVGLDRVGCCQWQLAWPLVVVLLLLLLVGQLPVAIAPCGLLLVPQMPAWAWQEPEPRASVLLEETLGEA